MSQTLAGLSKLYSQSNRHSFYGWPLGNNQSTGPASTVTSASKRSSTMPVDTSSSTTVSMPPATAVPSTTSRPRHRYSTFVPYNAANYTHAKSSTDAKKMRLQLPSNNILFEIEYQQENLEYMHVMEKQTMANVELMNVQPELHWFMRPYLVDFLIEIHQSFRLRPETLYLTMNLVDRYVSKRIVYKRHYQLVGCAALLIAAKFEDAKDRVPTVQELSQMCCNAYDPSAFTQMEGHVLSTLAWQLGHPTAEAWLRYEYSCAPPSNPSTHNVARFLLEVTLFHESFLTVVPSALAAGAMMLARHICRDPRPHPHQLGAAASAVMGQIHNHIVENLNDLSMILIKKYSYSYYTEASSIVVEWFRKHIEMKKAMEMTTSTPHMELCSSDDDIESQQSVESAASIFSTPSRSINRDDDDDDSMPLTPLSLHTAQDPTIAGVKASVHSARLPQMNASSTNRPIHTTSNDKGSSANPSWMSLAQLRPVAKHTKSAARMDMDAIMSEKTV